MRSAASRRHHSRSFLQRSWRSNPKRWLLHGNVFFDESDGNAEWETMREALGIRGFKTRPILVDSVYFGVPMHRRRSYLVCRVFVALIGRVLSFEEWHSLFDDLLAKCRRNPPASRKCCWNLAISTSSVNSIRARASSQILSFRFRVSDSEFQIQTFIFWDSQF